MRIYLSFFLAVFSASAFASDSLPDIAEAENQFTQATVDAKMIDGACAQARTDRKTCYQRASVVTAECRQKLRQQYFDSRSTSITVDRETYVTSLKDCVQTEIARQ